MGKVKLPEELMSGMLSPKESMLEVQPKNVFMSIGVPKENSFQENRVALTPQSVSVLVANGHRVLVESKAGTHSRFEDHAYTEAGAQIVYSSQEIFKADVVVKVSPFTTEEIAWTHPNQIIISTIHLPTVSAEYLEILTMKKVTALAFEYIQDEDDNFPIVTAMSEIAGSTSMLIASELLSNLHEGNGILLGGIAGIPPAEVVILGAGTVGEHATLAALALGATVKVFDRSIYKLRRLQRNLGNRIFTSTIRNDVLLKALTTADVAVGAIHSKSGRAPIVVTEEMVSQMKPGAVIIDVSIDQGGCFETSEITTHENPTLRKYDVIHYGVPNIPSRVSRTASQAISNVLMPLLLEAAEGGGFEQMLAMNPHIRNGVYFYRGMLTNLHLSEKFSMKYTNLDLLFTAGL